MPARSEGIRKGSFRSASLLARAARYAVFGGRDVRVVFEVGSHYEFAVVFTGRENPS